MRTDIYYWKCDSPLPIDQKRVYNDKYAEADITETVKAIATEFLSEAPEAIRHTGSAGNHYAYLIDHGGRTFFFRSDDGKIDDDYMLAEQAAMDLATRNGVPVPRLFACDVSMSRHPIRYQIFEHIPFPDLNKHDQAGTLDRGAVVFFATVTAPWMRNVSGDTFQTFGYSRTVTRRVSGTSRFSRIYINGRYWT